MKTTVETLLKLWRDEGFNVEKLKEETDSERTDLVWQLYRVYSDETYVDYGRHAVIRTLCKKNGELIEHEIFNQNQFGNPYEFPCVGSRSWISKVSGG